MPDLSSLRLNLAGRELVEDSPRHRMWRDAAGVFVKVADLVVNEPRARCAPYRVGTATAPGPSSLPVTEARARARPWWKPW